MWSSVTRFRAFGAALGFGLLYAWMETLAVRISVLSGHGLSPGAPLFLACLALALFAAGASSLQPFIERFRRELSVAGCVLMSSTPILLAATGFLPPAPSSVFSSVALALGGVGTALLLCRWGILLSAFEPDDIAVAFGVSPFVPVIAAAVAGGALLVAAPPVALYLLVKISATGGDASPLPRDVPLFDLALMLFCLHLAIGALSPLTEGVAGVPGWSVWIHPLATAFAALVFLFHRNADLPGFYRTALPVVGAALFLSGFFPDSRTTAVLAGGGTALLELYAWLLLMHVASASGARRGVVVAHGQFVIVCATVAASMSAGAADGRLAAFAFPLAILVALFAAWKRCGRILLLQLDASIPLRNEPAPETVPAADPPETPGAPEISDASAAKDDRDKLARFGLTSRETDVALLLLGGFRDASICASLFISRNTLKYHLRNIYRKTETGNRRELRDVVG
jgi:DNA-binding CsgD family transcriptional regulator